MSSAGIHAMGRERHGRVLQMQKAAGRVANDGWLALRSLFGGPARAQVIILLAAVLALNSADIATVGASATQLRQGLHISNADIGLLVAVSAAVAAIFSVPFGVLVDKANRVALLTVTISLWGVVMFLSALTSNFGQLLIARVLLGALTAVSGPAIASLIGDFFPAGERGKIYGYVLAGELVGAGAGFVITGDAADISWRVAFAILAVPTVPLAWILGHLPEPARGGASLLQPGALRIVGHRDFKRHGRAGGSSRFSDHSYDQGDSDLLHFQRREWDPESGEVFQGNGESQGGPSENNGHGPTDAQELADRLGISADPRLVLRSDPRRMDVLSMIRYVLSIRTNVFLIISGVCSYFFLTGVETFGLEFVKGQYHVPQLLANVLMLFVGAGAIMGVLVGGRLGDNLVKRGRLNGRIMVAAIAALITTLLFIPPFVTHSAFTALPYIIAAGFALTAQNPPIDAARLDIMPPLLWGRAEGVRSFVRTAAQALAPLIFGLLADWIGLRTTFAVMLLPFLASGIILIMARRTYPRDVATAAASAGANGSGEGLS